MSSVVYAQGLARKQGIDRAIHIADNCLQITQSVVTNGGGLPFDEEVYQTEQTTKNSVTGKLETKMITIVNEGKKAKRQQKTLKFWTNVLAQLQILKKKTSKAA